MRISNPAFYLTSRHGVSQRCLARSVLSKFIIPMLFRWESERMGNTCYWS